MILSSECWLGGLLLASRQHICVGVVGLGNVIFFVITACLMAWPVVSVFVFSAGLVGALLL